MSGRDDDLYDILLDSPRDVSDLLKSASHPGRVLILALLLKGEQSLSSLVEGTGLSKNALVNHLGLLIDNRLVQRVGRGSYTLTVDGEDFISNVATLFRDSAIREEQRRERMRSRYAVGWRGDGMSERVMFKPGTVFIMDEVSVIEGLQTEVGEVEILLRFDGSAQLIEIVLP